MNEERSTLLGDLINKQIQLERCRLQEAIGWNEVFKNLDYSLFNVMKIKCIIFEECHFETSKLNDLQDFEDNEPILRVLGEVYELVTKLEKELDAVRSSLDNFLSFKNNLRQPSGIIRRFIKVQQMVPFLVDYINCIAALKCPVHQPKK